MSPDTISPWKFLRLCTLATTIGVAAAVTQAADGPPAGKSAAESQRREEWCKANPEKCKEMQAKMKERQEKCNADPEKCRAEMQANRDERFRQADVNKDGKLTREEAQKGLPWVARRFDEIDTNKDGVITKQELDAAAKAREAQRKDKSG